MVMLKGIFVNVSDTFGKIYLFLTLLIVTKYENNTVKLLFFIFYFLLKIEKTEEAKFMYN